MFLTMTNVNFLAPKIQYNFRYPPNLLTLLIKILCLTNTHNFFQCILIAIFGWHFYVLWLIGFLSKLLKKFGTFLSWIYDFPSKSIYYIATATVYWPFIWRLNRVRTVFCFTLYRILMGNVNGITLCQIRNG